MLLKTWSHMHTDGRHMTHFVKCIHHLAVKLQCVYVIHTHTHTHTHAHTHTATATVSHTLTYMHTHSHTTAPYMIHASHGYFSINSDCFVSVINL